MTTELIILFTVLALLAETLGTVSGFGSSVFFVPIASFFFDFHTVLGVTALFHIFSNISKIVFFRDGINWRMVIQMGIPAMIFVSIGAFFSKWFDGELLESILAAFLILFSILFLVFHKIFVRPTRLNSFLGGSISGFVAGFVGTGGAIRGMALSAFKMEKAVFIATSAIIDFGVDLSRGAVYFSNGYMHKHDLKYVLILLGVSILGTYLGKIILNRISEEQFKKIVLVVILGIGLVTLINQIVF